jgi:hypothetical protein
MSRNQKDSYTGTHDGMAFFIGLVLISIITLTSIDNPSINKAHSHNKPVVRIAKVETVALPRRKPIPEGTQEWEWKLLAAYSEAAERHMKPVKGYPLPVPTLQNHK